jgi:hypothetical protein
MSFSIPENTVLFKISSFNLNLYDNINRNDNIDTIVDYILSNSNISNDIICLQGINDRIIGKLLIKNIIDRSDKNMTPFQYIPKLNINTSNDSFELTWSSSANSDAKCIDSVILSKYPILSSSQIELNDANMIESKKVIIANIIIKNHLVSIYNVSLTDDSSGISNSEFRKKEIEKLNQIINENSNYNKEFNKKYNYGLIVNDIHVICGNINVNEIKNNEINPEIIEIFKLLKGIDAIKCQQNNNIYDFINIDNNIKDYIIIILFKHIYDTSYNNKKELLKKLFQEQCIGIVLSNIVNSIKINDNNPLETILLLRYK